MKGYKKIDFQKLVDGDYCNQTQLQVIQWIYKTAKPYNPETVNWGRNGIDKTIFGYGANEHSSTTPILNVQNFCESAFLRTLIKTPPLWLLNWRKKEGVNLSSSRMLKIDSDRQNKDLYKGNLSVTELIFSLQGYKGVSLKKEKFHPTYTDRINPYLKSIKFSLSGCGQFFVEYDFSFDMEGFEGNSWSKEFNQNIDETLRGFLLRVHFEISKSLKDKKC